MTAAIALVVLVIALALVFDFTNGFHDTANAMATPIATGAMRPRVAVAVAAVLNLIGAFLSTTVAQTISGGLIKEGQTVQVGPELVFAGLIGAIVWNITTWYFGLPSSSSHALFGGLIGASLVGAGFGAIDYGVLLGKIIIPAVLAPLTAAIVAILATRIAYAITRRNDGRRDGRGVFRVGQLFSSSLVALAHGTNDAQKTMGVITLVLITAGLQKPGTAPQLWVIAACALAIAVGTYTGGWRIIKTVGTGLTAVRPAQGFAAEVSTASTILASSHLGFALSTTHVASGSVVGSGIGRRRSKVQWGTVRRIVAGWVVTLPAAAIVGAVAALLVKLGPTGIVIDAVLGVGFMVAVFLRARPNRVDANSLEREVNAAGAAVVRVRKTKQKRGATA
ncbi:inorganic phosphate transporter [Amnibacterium sp. CER49]|uniref:inorganic phosphate transporter n=1 Tax=Amnibacterium sp. CER49 TaxID=3039161 RepID=UPI002447C8D3|nr:inorganic phosphate transporter [Amnibacterium sp. CER49]MDH2444611.1 inorganic phosphate transporter [Amnibacterium sp. CER49]